MDGTFHLPEVERSQGSLLNLAKGGNLSGLRDQPAPSSSFQKNKRGSRFFTATALSLTGALAPLF